MKQSSCKGMKDRYMKHEKKENKLIGSLDRMHSRKKLKKMVGGKGKK